MEQPHQPCHTRNAAEPSLRTPSLFSSTHFTTDLFIQEKFTNYLYAEDPILSVPRFFSLSTTDIPGWIILSSGDYAMNCRTMSSISGPYPLKPSCDVQNCFHMFPNVSSGAKSPPVENHYLMLRQRFLNFNEYKTHLRCWFKIRAPGPCLLIFNSAMLR